MHAWSGSSFGDLGCSENVVNSRKREGGMLNVHGEPGSGSSWSLYRPASPLYSASPEMLHFVDSREIMYEFPPRRFLLFTSRPFRQQHRQYQRSPPPHSIPCSTVIPLSSAMRPFPLCSSLILSLSFSTLAYIRQPTRIILFSVYFHKFPYSRISTNYPTSV